MSFMFGSFKMLGPRVRFHSFLGFLLALAMAFGFLVAPAQAADYTPIQIRKYAAWVKPAKYGNARLTKIGSALCSRLDSLGAVNETTEVTKKWLKKKYKVTTVQAAHLRSGASMYLCPDAGMPVAMNLSLGADARLDSAAWSGGQRSDTLYMWTANKQEVNGLALSKVCDGAVLPLGNAASLGAKLSASQGSRQWYNNAGVTVELLDAAGATLFSTTDLHEPGVDPINAAATVEVSLGNFPTAASARVSQSSDWPPGMCNTSAFLSMFPIRVQDPTYFVDRNAPSIQVGSKTYWLTDGVRTALPYQRPAAVQ